MTSAYDKIKELKARREVLKTDFQIQVDGGVTDQNSKALITAGADNLVAGSYVFKTTKDNYAKKLNLLDSLKHITKRMYCH